MKDLLQEKPKIIGENLNIFFSSDLVEIFEKCKKLKMNLMTILYRQKFCYIQYYVLTTLISMINIQKNGLTIDKIKEIIKKLRKGETINSNSKSIDLIA